MEDVVEIIVQDGIPGPQGPAGAQGDPGMDGLSAYEIWLAEGNTGTEQDFLNSLIGPQGPQGIQGEKGDKGDPGNDGEQGTPGTPGADGASAYEVAVDNGFIGTEEQWLESLKGDPGEKGDKGDKGDPGQGIVLEGSVPTVDDLPNDLGEEDAGSSYIVESNGHLYTWSGTQWIDAGEIKGEKGDKGDDGREIEIQANSTHIQWRYVGDSTWTNLVALIDLKGDKGDKGDPGTTDYNNLDNVPATFPPSAHTHNADDIDSGTLGEERIPALAISKIAGLQDELDGKLAVGSGTQDATTYRRGDGTWATPPDTTYSVISQSNAQDPSSTADGLVTGQRLAQAVEGRIVPVTGNKTLALTDRMTYQRVTAAATITIPANATVAFPVGTRIDFFQSDSGIITFSAAGGVTVNSYGDTLVTDGKGAAASLKKVGTNEWDLII